MSGRNKHEKKGDSSPSATAQTAALLNVSPSAFSPKLDSPDTTVAKEKSAIETKQSPTIHPAKQLVEGIKQKLKKLEGFRPYPDIGGGNFHQALSAYDAYHATLSSEPEKQKILSEIFWDQIYILGTPIIETNPKVPAECNVYFLMPKDKLAKSTEALGATKDLYLQGDFHGYNSVTDKQKLSELSNTGIMCRVDSIPTGSMVVYKYIQVEPGHPEKPNPEISPFFKKDATGFVPVSTTARSPEIPQGEVKEIPKKMECKDEYSKHTFPFPDFDGPKRLFPESADRVFRVSTDPVHAYIPGKPVDWPNLLRTKQNNKKHFVYHATLYSDRDGNLTRSEAKVTRKYHDDLNFSDQAGSPYAKYTRDIQVFKPASGKVDNVVVVNDGIPYLLTGIMDHLEKMVAENKLSPNTAFVFVHPLPGLKTTLSTLPPKKAAEFDMDQSVSNPGMGIRLIDYRYGIDNYTEFLTNKLFPQLKAELNVPKDASHRVMIGSSLSGTASMYIGLKHPKLFGAVIAQSPSPSNREILREITPEEMQAKRNIHLSCGQFECPERAAANDNLGYAMELHTKLDLQLLPGAHGHQFVAWTEELEQSLSETLKNIHAHKAGDDPTKSPTP